MVAETESQTSGWCRRTSAATVPLPTAVGPARTIRRERRGALTTRRGAELTLERGDLLDAQAAHAAALGDAEALHHLAGAHPAEAGHRLEQLDDAHLADDLVGLALRGRRR